MKFKVIIFALLCLAAAGSALALKPTFTDPINPGGGGIGGFEQMLIKVLRWLWPISIVVAVLMVLIGAYYFVFSAGDPAKAATGRKVIVYALVGLAIVGGAIGIWNVIKLILGI